MLSIIISWKNRKQLRKTVNYILPMLNQLNAELIIVNYNGCTSLLNDQLKDYYHRNLKIVTVENETFFNKSKAQNIGAAYANNEFLFFCDSDIIVDIDVISNILNHLKTNTYSFGTIEYVVETNINNRNASNVTCFGYNLNIRLQNNAYVEIIDQEEDASDGKRMAPGLLFVSKHHFQAVEGYNGRLHGWGWEDQDMICRLSLNNSLKRYQHGTFKHISHSDTERLENYPFVKTRWENRDKMFRQALEFYDNNDLSGSYTTDVTILDSEVSIREANIYETS